MPRYAITKKAGRFVVAPSNARVATVLYLTHGTADCARASFEIPWAQGEKNRWHLIIAMSAARLLLADRSVIPRNQLRDHFQRLPAGFHSSPSRAFAASFLSSASFMPPRFNSSELTLRNTGGFDQTARLLERLPYDSYMDPAFVAAAWNGRPRIFTDCPLKLPALT